MSQAQYAGTGRRKNAVARVRLVPGTGKITVNKKDVEEYIPHADLRLVKQVSLTKQGSWKLILEDESAGRELFPILTQGQYIATFDQQAPTIDEIFKLESGVEV